MAKKSLIQREHKRKKLEEKYRLIRQCLKKKSKDSSLSQRERREIKRKLQFLPRNSAPTRLHRRTGRPRVNYSRFWTIRAHTSTNGSCMFITGCNKIKLVRIIISFLFLPKRFCT